MITTNIQENIRSLCKCWLMNSIVTSRVTSQSRKIPRRSFAILSVLLLKRLQKKSRKGQIEFQNQRHCKDEYESVYLEKFWKNVKKQFHIRIGYLILEQGCCALIIIENKARNRLEASDDVRVALSNSITPRISNLVKRMQASHWFSTKHFQTISTIHFTDFLSNKLYSDLLWKMTNSNFNITDFMRNYLV